MQRIDQLLVSRGKVSSRSRAQRLIAEGRVQVQMSGGWETPKKAGQKYSEVVEIKVELDAADRYVSRGGMKLAGALAVSSLDITDHEVIDVGQSTGGFTDCALQSGAAKVVGIEVGHDQLVDSLRGDSRVICLEGMNARELSQSLLEYTREGEGFDLAVMDVSFISQTKILPSLAPLLKPGGQLLSLVKPQFEVGPSGLGKGGIVQDEALYPEVESKITGLCEQLGLKVQGYFESSIQGGDGNREFFVWAWKARQKP